MDVFLRYYYSSKSFQWTKHTYISVVQCSNAWMNELQRMLVYYLRLACLIGVAPDTWLNNLEFNTWGDLTLDASLDDIHSLFRASIRAFHFRGVHMQCPLLRPYEYPIPAVLMTLHSQGCDLLAQPNLLQSETHLSALSSTCDDGVVQFLHAFSLVGNNHHENLPEWHQQQHHASLTACMYIQIQRCLSIKCLFFLEFWLY